MHHLDPYQVDNLLLLIGGNPLPNYVAAQLLTKDRATTKIILVCSADTRDEAAQRIERQLKAEGFGSITYCEVEEANPQNIRSQVTQAIQGLSGSIGLHYTGGTKAMSVHAYLALQTKADSRAQYSYLDARRLELQIETGGTPHTIPDIGMRLQSPLTIEVLLKLHDLDHLKQDMKDMPIWAATAQTLAELYTDADRARGWREWCNRTLRNEKDLLPTASLSTVAIKDIPSAAVQASFLVTYPDLTSDDSLIRLAENVGMPVNKRKVHLAKWLDGEWLEHYVFHTLQPLKDNGMLHDLRMTINPDLTKTDFEFDVAGIRGYQLFAFSVSTASPRHLKSKLLEVVVRAEQMGGSEARVALVCCASREDVQKLEHEIATLFRQRQVTRVFGRDDLLDLHDKVANWISNPGQGERL